MPSKISTVEAKKGNGSVKATPNGKDSRKGSKRRSRSRSQSHIAKTPLDLTRDAIDILRQMLIYLDPEAAAQLPVGRLPLTGSSTLPPPISEWNVLYASSPASVSSSSASAKAHLHQPTSQVLSYPGTDKNLFCVRSVIPDLSAHQFWTLMAESGNRHLWDSTVQEGGNWRWLHEEIQDDSDSERRLAKGIAARLEYLKFGSIFMVAKPRDMLLLSADACLPPTAESPLRMVSACRSEVDDTKPPLKGYTRYDLGVGGFMVEDLSTDQRKSVRVTQLSDLGDMASWVPASVVRMVAQTLVPRSISLITKAARSMVVPKALGSELSLLSTDMHEEEINPKTKQRWSRARGIPCQIGTGVLSKDRELLFGRSPKRPPHVELAFHGLSAPLMDVSEFKRPTSSVVRGAEFETSGSSRESIKEGEADDSGPRALGVRSGDSATPHSPSRPQDDTEGLDHTSNGSSQPQQPAGQLTTEQESTRSSSRASHSLDADITSSSRSSDPQVQLADANDLSRRLQRISRAFWKGDGISRTDNPAIDDGQGDEIESEDEASISDGDTQPNREAADELVDDLMVDALSVSLQGGAGASHFSLRHLSPERNHEDMTPFGSPKARRRATELSAILLRGSDALVSALAPGARDTVVAASDNTWNPLSMRVSRKSSLESSAKLPLADSATVNQQHSRHPLLCNASSGASIKAPVAAQMTMTSALGLRGGQQASGDDKSAPDSPARSGYGLALGAVALLWARSGRTRIGKAAEESDWDVTPSAAVVSARKILLHAPPRLAARRLSLASERSGGTSGSPDHPGASPLLDQGSVDAFIPLEGTEPRRRSRRNYQGNAKLLTGSSTTVKRISKASTASSN